MITTGVLSEDAKELASLANENLGILTGKCQQKEELQDYYLGILRRQAIILLDLERLLKGRNSGLITTPFIILRSLMDDFLHLLYLELFVGDKYEEIVKINAKAHKQVFQSLKDLTESNHKYFNDKYPFYLTHEQYKTVQEKFVSIPENEKYFRDKESFKFKSFITLAEMVKKINASRDVNIFRDRAFYLWKEFSGFVHYSNFSFYLELKEDVTHLQKMDEAFQYTYNSIYLSFKHFERALELKFIDNEVLQEKYGIIHDC
ncbi:MAG: hypothetical protein JNK14_08740 [Chitinophagaceae bacterium]|nr:hypothetical protein [Chitinophagaceae bacterium]